MIPFMTCKKAVAGQYSDRQQLFVLIGLLDKAHGRIGDQSLHDISHMLWTVVLVVGQPGFDQTDAASHAVGKTILDVVHVFGKLMKQIRQDMVCNKLFHVFYKYHIAIWSDQCGADILVFL